MFASPVYGHNNLLANNLLAKTVIVKSIHYKSWHPGFVVLFPSPIAPCGWSIVCNLCLENVIIICHSQGVTPRNICSMNHCGSVV